MSETQVSPTAPEADTDVLVDVRGVKVHFPIKRGVVFDRTIGHVYAVDGVDLQIRRGETYGLVGESGCGKSMLGKAIQQTNGYSPDELRRLEIFSHTWFHVTRQGGFTILHTHPMASWSGVYCVSPGDAVPDKPESGVLRFHNPHGYSNTFMDPGNAHFKPPYHHGSWSFALEAGQLVLFPSWLQHEVLPYYGQSPRITVAFNCWFGTKQAG